MKSWICNWTDDEARQMFEDDLVGRLSDRELDRMDDLDWEDAWHVCCHGRHLPAWVEREEQRAGLRPLAWELDLLREDLIDAGLVRS